jgi:hypothetical protein
MMVMAMEMIKCSAWKRRKTKTKSSRQWYNLIGAFWFGGRDT